MRRSEFCRSRHLSFGTLNRHLRKQRWKKRAASSSSPLIPVELTSKKSSSQHQPNCSLAVVLSGGRRIEVHPGFDSPTFERLVTTLERA